MNVVILNNAEHTSHSSDDPALLTVMNIASADNMTSDIFLQPAMILSAADGVPLHLRRTFYMVARKKMIVFRIIVFSEGNSGTFTSPDLTIFNNPSSGPVRSDHAVLISRRRCPCCGRFINVKTTDRNVSDSVFPWKEALPAHGNLNILPARVCSLEISINNRLIFLRILFGVPLPPGGLRVPGTLIDSPLRTFLQCFRLVQSLIVQPDTSGMPATPGKIPVAENIRCIGVVISKNAIVDSRDINISPVRFPGLHFFGAGNFRFQRLQTSICNACIFSSRVDRIYILPVYAGGNKYFIPGLRPMGGIIDAAKRHLLCPIAVMTSGCIYINYHPVPPGTSTNISFSNVNFYQFYHIPDHYRHKKAAAFPFPDGIAAAFYHYFICTYSGK